MDDICGSLEAAQRPIFHYDDSCSIIHMRKLYNRVLGKDLDSHAVTQA